MKTPRTARLRTRTDHPVAERSGFVAFWLRIWFTPVDPIGLHAVRILAGLVFLAWLLPFAGHLDSLFGGQGWFDLQMYADAARLQAAAPVMGDDSPLRFGWTVLFWIGPQSNHLSIVYWSAIVVVVLFSLGIFTRLTSILTWVTIVSFTANPVLESDGDVLVRLLAMYLMIGYVLLNQSEPGLAVWSRLVGSRDTLLLGRREARPCIWANLALRLLQVHLVIVVVTSAMHKLQFAEWWAGFALWYPVFSQTKFAEIRQLAPYRDYYLGILSLATYLVLAWQFAFPFFAWRPRWRMLLLGGAAAAWLANAWLFHVPTFGPAFVVCCLSFVTPVEWYRLLGLLGRLPLSAVLARRLPADNDCLEWKGSKTTDAASCVAVGHR